jgi:hypothetical protein
VFHCCIGFYVKSLFAAVVAAVGGIFYVFVTAGNILLLKLLKQLFKCSSKMIIKTKWSGNRTYTSMQGTKGFFL